MLVPDVASVTVGALSLSVIVIVTDCVPLSLALPPETPLISIVAVSLDVASYKLSSVRCKRYRSCCRTSRNNNVVNITLPSV